MLITCAGSIVVDYSLCYPLHFQLFPPAFSFFFQIENSCTYVRLCVCVSVCVTQNIQTSAHTHQLNTLSSNLECFKFE